MVTNPIFLAGMAADAGVASGGSRPRAADGAVFCPVVSFSSLSQSNCGPVPSCPSTLWLLHTSWKVIKIIMAGRRHGEKGLRGDALQPWLPFYFFTCARIFLQLQVCGCKRNRQDTHVPSCFLFLLAPQERNSSLLGKESWVFIFYKDADLFLLFLSQTLCSNILCRHSLTC